MQSWGTGLYENDLTLAIKEEFEELLQQGQLPEGATIEVVEHYSYCLRNTVKEPLLWFSLADTQWSWGVLLPDVKTKALQWLDKNGDLEVWQNENPQRVLERQCVLNDLRAKLLSDQPSVKQRKKRRLYKCQWQLGDVFAYQLKSDIAREKGLLDHYFLIHKVDEAISYPGHIVPIVYVKLTIGDMIPTTLEEYNQLPFVQTDFCPYEWRFMPIDGRRPTEDVEEKSKILYEKDEFGYLPVFRIKLQNTSPKIIPHDLIYVGNFTNLTSPQKEFIPHAKINIRSVYWKNLNSTFESKMIQAYCNHNLRELSIYHPE